MFLQLEVKLGAVSQKSGKPIWKAPFNIRVLIIAELHMLLHIRKLLGSCRGGVKDGLVIIQGIP